MARIPLLPFCPSQPRPSLEQKRRYEADEPIRTELVVLARYMQVLHKQMCEYLDGRAIISIILYYQVF